MLLCAIKESSRFSCGHTLQYYSRETKLLVAKVTLYNNGEVKVFVNGNDIYISFGTGFGTKLQKCIKEGAHCLFMLLLLYLLLHHIVSRKDPRGTWNNQTNQNKTSHRNGTCYLNIL